MNSSGIKIQNIDWFNFKEIKPYKNSLNECFEPAEVSKQFTKRVKDQIAMMSSGDKVYWQSRIVETFTRKFQPDLGDLNSFSTIISLLFNGSPLVTLELEFK